MNLLEQQLQKATRLNEITQKVGFALWQLQELELVAAQYFVLIAQAEKGMGFAAGNALVEKAQNKTFGSTVYRLTQSGLVSSELGLRLNSLLSERNWLVHKSRASSRNAIHCDIATEKLILRLTNIAEDALDILKAIGFLAEDYVKKHGISEDDINEAAKRLLAEWHASDET
jgi:uncharacterized protein YutE (UPF0331/DUF86 family)